MLKTVQSELALTKKEKADEAARFEATRENLEAQIRELQA